MKEKEIFEQFIKESGIDRTDVVDYRYCTSLYAGVYIKDAIIIQLDKKYQQPYLIYKANNINAIIDELLKTMENKTSFEKGFHSALNTIKNMERKQ